MNATEYREQLIKQYEQAVTNVEQLRGAIAACNNLIKTEDDELTTDIEADESDA